MYIMNLHLRDTASHYDNTVVVLGHTRVSIGLLQREVQYDIQLRMQ